MSRKIQEFSGNPTQKFPVTIPETDKLVTYECVIEGCACITTYPTPKNPRDRWAINVSINDETQDVHRLVHLCPHHAKIILNLDEEFYVRTENAEALVRGE